MRRPHLNPLFLHKATTGGVQLSLVLLTLIGLKQHPQSSNIIKIICEAQHQPICFPPAINLAINHLNTSLDLYP